MKGSVLIADDEPLARRTLREFLLDVGWEGPIQEVTDGEEAIAVANDQHPGLLFLDIVMPGATGLEVLKRLDYEPKVIFTTAHDNTRRPPSNLALSIICSNHLDAAGLNSSCVGCRLRRMTCLFL
jgi:CheY-like chemotaxis protein